MFSQSKHTHAALFLAIVSGDDATIVTMRMMMTVVVMVLLVEDALIPLLLFLLLILIAVAITIPVTIAVTVAVAITVAIAITIAITVIAVATSLLADAIKHDAKVGELILLIELLDIKEQAFVGLASTQHHDGGIGNTFHDVGISHHSHRHIIEEDVFITFAKLGNQIVQTRTHQQLGRVGRHGS